MPSSTISCEPPRVLLVDDNAAVLVHVAAILAPGCDIVGTATDGWTALAAARNLLPDVIVLDISMPGMTGLEVAASLRAAGSTAALVFLSVHEEDVFIAAATAAGGIGYVVKPRLAFDLAIAVQEARAGRPFISSAR